MARATTGWPIFSAESGPTHYLEEIRPFPMLLRGPAQEELALQGQYKWNP